MSACANCAPEIGLSPAYRGRGLRAFDKINNNTVIPQGETPSSEKMLQEIIDKGGVHMPIFVYPLMAVYIFLLIFGFKSTWKFVSDLVLAGSSEIVFAIILFILLFLVIGPITGIINLVKLVILKMSFKNKE
jgi:hypothetical protein